jgi:pimeloyl-ACP methyl ester carboxylesterase
MLIPDVNGKGVPLVARLRFDVEQEPGPGVRLMMRDERLQAILLPGGVLPAELAYPDLVRALGIEVDARFKEHELYASSEPPAGWGLETEVEAIRRFADEADFEQFHLVGYSGGGAIAIAFCVTYPERLASLALNEPAWTGNEDLSEDERELGHEFERIMAMPPEQMMPAFVRAQLAPGVEPPPRAEGPPPSWMATRPAGLNAFTRAFKTFSLDIERLRAFDRPVLHTIGGRSNPVAVRLPAERLGRIFPDFTLEIFEERHHFDPPHRAEPQRYARSLRKLWDRASGKA